MKELLRKLLGVEKLYIEIKDLHLTCDSLKDKATHINEQLDKAIGVLMSFDLADPTKPWWDSINASKLSGEQWVMATRIQQSEKQKFVHSNPSLKVKQVFHGGCIGCVRPTTEGIGNCRGCQYFEHNWNMPSKFIDKDGKSK